MEKKNLIEGIEARIVYYAEKIAESTDKLELYQNKWNMLKLCIKYINSEPGARDYQEFEFRTTYSSGWDSGFFSHKTKNLVAETIQFVKDYEEYKVINRAQSKMKSARVARIEDHIFIHK